MFAFVKTARWDRVDPDAREAFARADRSPRRSRGGAGAVRGGRGGGRVAPARHGSGDGREPRPGVGPPGAPACPRRCAPGSSAAGRCARSTTCGALARIPQLDESFAELFAQRYDAILTPAAAGTAPAGPRLDRGPGLLHPVDPVRHAGAQRAAHAGRQRSPAGRPAGRARGTAMPACCGPRAGSWPGSRRTDPLRGSRKAAPEALGATGGEPTETGERAGRGEARGRAAPRAAPRGAGARCAARPPAAAGEPPRRSWSPRR